MADIINLRKARKTRSRAQEKVRADSNRIVFGRTKDEKRAAKAEIARQARLLDGAKREGD